MGNIRLGDAVSNNHISVRGKKLNLRWFDRCILIWSDEDDEEPLPKKCLEAVEEALKIKEKKDE